MEFRDRVHVGIHSETPSLYPFILECHRYSITRNKRKQDLHQLPARFYEMPLHYAMIIVWDESGK